MSSLKSQHVVIIGGSSHMGLETARLANAAGAQITLVARDEVRLREAALLIGADVRWLAADATDDAATEAALRSLTPIDHLVMTMSVQVPASSVVQTPIAIAKLAFERFWASYRIVQLAPRLLNPGGSVTLLSGSSGRRPVRGYGVWTALHGAIEALARAAALEIAPLRLNIVSPGGIGMKPDRNLVHRAGEARDVGAMVVSLMSNPAVTNAVVDVDSGERLGQWSGG
jgi:NAD(P)-dependent dehydrogenase (short-subunit alcohol dehydrogenase family)